MIIADVHEKCKSLIIRLRAMYAGIPRDAVVVSVLVLVSSLSFGLGYLAGLDAGESTTISLTEFHSATPVQAEQARGQVVASKSGTKYYFPGCAGASRISKENQVWFATDRAAISAGYELATNCKGK